ncbi:MAG: hypothetical protein DI570_16440 [Phenylobacterium zucineum]|nr:MAG: hypothetical protein DI570_16440 [Phenylobacterium zucineum]
MTTAPISMEETHHVAAGVVGELSLAIVRQKASKALMESWIARLRDVADRMEAKIQTAGAPST